ncbi:MAG: hypothetical protein LBS60_14615 [Deltaproteobacteria bacterium]|nr:hypothetical protein [Deltaproteobacteria bacterium]
MIAKLAQTNAQLEAFAQSQLANQAALTARSEAAEALIKEKDIVIAKLRKWYESDAEACAWRNGRIPDSVYRQLC